MQSERTAAPTGIAWIVAATWAAACSGGDLENVPGGMPRESAALLEEALAPATQNLIALDRNALTNPDEQWLGALLFDDGVVRFEPATRNAPWYQVAITETGETFLAAVARDAPTFVIAAPSFTNVECWSESEVRRCAADASVPLAPRPPVDAFIGTGNPPPIVLRPVFVRDPRAGGWRVENAPELQRGARAHLSEWLQTLLRDRGGTYAEAMAEARDYAIERAYDQIFARLSQQFRPDQSNGTVTIVGRHLQFARHRVEGRSFPELFAACENLSWAGHSDWRLSTRAEFLTFLSRRGGQTYAIQDTPDQRIWNYLFEFPQTGSASSFVVNTFSVVGRSDQFPVSELASRSGMITSYTYTPRGNGLLAEGTTYSSQGYWNMRNIGSQWRGSPKVALCVRADA